jgi:hemoglobin
MNDQELFEQLGGVDGVAQLVELFYQRVIQDQELAPFFAKVDMDRLRKMQYEFIVSALGGPVHYSGTELREAHAGRGITNQHFAKFVGHLADAMEHQGISHHLVDAMLGRLATYRDKIVGGPTSDG